MSSGAAPSAQDLASIEVLLGRPIRGRCRVVVRGPGGEPAVIENDPFLEDGTPMPTLFWLLDPELSRAVGRLESAGGVDRAEAELGEAVLAAAHAAHERMRRELISPEHQGPLPSGGVGGTRRGVKCLHAHLAAELASGDPVGAWVREQLLDDPLLARRLNALVVVHG